MVQVDRYWVYAGEDYYPRKIFGDLRKTFDDLDEAVEYAKSLHTDWVSLVDMETKRSLKYEDL